MEKKIHDFCLNILAHNEIDSEVTLNGNGICCAEAAGVAFALMKMLNIKVSNAEVKALAKELRKEYGLSDE